MVKSVLGTYHPGLRDWIIQRMSAVVMTVYIIGLVLFFVAHPDLEFPDWHEFFSSYCVKISTMIAILSLILHAWVGMWTIFTDYIKSFTLRLFVEVVTFLALATFFFAGLFIIGSV